MSRVIQILTAESPASEMRPRAEIRAVPGQGLGGDRYFSGTGTYLAKISFPETLKGLVHKGGSRAQILSEGVFESATQSAWHEPQRPFP